MVVTSAACAIFDMAGADTPLDQVEMAVIKTVERGLAAPEQPQRNAANAASEWLR